MNDWVLVTPHATADTTEGGIIIPDSVKKRINRGNVMAVGPGRPVDGLAMHLFVRPTGVSPHLADEQPAVDKLKEWPRRPMTVQEGDVIHYPEFAAVDISSDDGNYIMVKEEDIVAKE
jgi:chaperonin GroES